MPKYGDYTQANNLQSSDIFLIKQGNQTKQITAQQIVNACNTANVIIDDNSLDFTKLKDVTKKVVNKFNKNTVTFGGIWLGDGWRPNSNMCSSDFIKVTPNEKYFKPSSSYNNNVEYYDIDKKFKSNAQRSGVITIPSNVHWIRFGCSITEYENMTFNVGDTQMDYEDSVNTTEDYIYVIDGSKVTISKNEVNKKDYSKYSAINIGNPLFIETYYSGGNQPMHPKVLDFYELTGNPKWNGYRYWMAYTPLPYYDEREENPCIACSNDLIKWTVPDGFDNFTNNPLDRADTSKENYLSDTDLVYNPSLNKLEVWYRGYKRSTAEYIYRKTTTDGVNWSDRESIFTLNSDEATRLLCPCVIYENNQYTIWVSERVTGGSKIVRYNSTDGTNWTNRTETNVTGTWHADIIYNKTFKRYEMLNYYNTALSIYYYYSSDGLNWVKPEQGRDNKALIRNDTLNFPTEKMIGELYRPSFLFFNRRYYVFLGMRQADMKSDMYLAISENEDINTLQGIGNEYENRMSKPTRKPRFGEVGDCVFDVTLNKPIWCKEKSTSSTGSAKWVDVNGNEV